MGEAINQDRPAMIIRSDETQDVEVPGHGTMRMHLFRPAIEGRFPGVLLFSEIYQVTAPIRRLAAMLAGQGYVVAVPEVYHEYEPAGTVLAYDKPGTDRGNDLKFTKPVAAYDADATAALTALAAHPACNGHLGTFGVCLGGHLAYRAALDPRVGAAACFYATDIHSGTLGEGAATTAGADGRTEGRGDVRLGTAGPACSLCGARGDPGAVGGGRGLL